MIGTGFMKCIPITLSGLLVDAAMESMLMLEVFVASIV